MDKAEVSGRENFTFHRQTTHPLVSKKGTSMVPGWNASNDEITANGRHGCYVLFDKHGQLIFQGRQTYEEIEARVKQLLGAR